MKKGTRILLWVADATVVLGGVGGFVAGRYYVDNKMPNLSDEYVLFVRPDMRAYLLPLASAVVAASIHRCHIPVHIWIVGCALAIETSRCVHPAFVVGDVTEGVVLACCV
jgi:hypothetical protein